MKKGKTLDKICGNDVNFKNQFSFQRPFFGIAYEFDSILKFQGQVFVLNILGNDKKIRLKGQFICDDLNDLLYFWGSPYINSDKEFESIGLNIKDYSSFDWNISFLQVEKFLEFEQQDKKRLKYHFEKQKNFYELLFDYIPMDVAIFNSDLKYIYINKSAIKNDELRNWLRGKSYFDYCKYRNLDLSLAEEREDNFKDVLLFEKTHIYEDTYFEGTENEKTILRKMTPYTSFDGKKYILAYGIDISSVKKANKEIIKKNNELNKLNLELDGLVYSVTHDIRSPLHAVLGLIDVIESEEELNDRTTEYISLIKSSINRLDETINLIFDYSRNARTEVQSNEIDLIELINNLFLHNIKQHKTDIELIITKDLRAKFYSDPQRIKSIVNSLIANAIMFSRKDVKSYLEIFIKLDASKCEMIFSDNGEGILEKHHELIFDMFYRASKKSIGSGLGLFICKEAIEKLNGTIEFNSIPNKGSNFIVKLPNDLFLHEKEIHFN